MLALPKATWHVCLRRGLGATGPRRSGLSLQGPLLSLILLRFVYAHVYVFQPRIAAYLMKDRVALAVTLV